MKSLNEFNHILNKDERDRKAAEKEARIKKRGLAELDRLKKKYENNLTVEFRDASPEEHASIQKYIDSISEPTGVNFYEEVGKCQ